MAEELQYKGEAQEKEQKFHAVDTDITVEEMWKGWQYSQIYNWSTENLVDWLDEHVKLPQYGDYFRRNQIDGQFLPRLAVNDNNYLTNIMQIKDLRHKRLLMIKCTDLVLFGYQSKPHNLIKDALMVGALTLSILACIYLYSKHNQSLDQIKHMMSEFEKLADADAANISANNSISNEVNNFSSSLKRNLTNDLFNLNFLRQNQMNKENKLLEKNNKLSFELNAAKKEAEYLKKEREETLDGQNKQLELALKELEKVRAALRQTEVRAELVKFQAPPQLLNLLNRAYDSEKELFDYKHKIIEKEKNLCHGELNKLSKRQSGMLGAFKLVHSSYIEDLNHRIDLIK
jgi:stromal interaction molecule 1